MTQEMSAGLKESCSFGALDKQLAGCRASMPVWGAPAGSSKGDPVRADLETVTDAVESDIVKSDIVKSDISESAISGT
jgi:thiazole synthase ThiGH ThiG subunit